MEHKKAHEPLLRMAKRGTALPGWKAWGIRLIGFLLSLVACALLIVSVVHISPLKVSVSYTHLTLPTNSRV